MFNRSRWLRRRYRKRVLVQTAIGTFDGVLLATDSDGLLLVRCTFTGDGKPPTDLVGDTFVPRRQILFIQGVPFA